ncbi:MAG: glutathione S-transferase C-terminal domain-containing protein, partial [Dokdonella sp.]
VDESKRLLGVMNSQMEDHDWIAGADYSVADIATIGWVNNLITFYEARDLVGFERYTNVVAWLRRGLARPAVQRGLSIPSRE